jgi:hypothetical protein
LQFFAESLRERLEIDELRKQQSAQRLAADLIGELHIRSRQVNGPFGVGPFARASFHQLLLQAPPDSGRRFLARL